jgi:hypothetical protein
MFNKLPYPLQIDKLARTIGKFISFYIFLKDFISSNGIKKGQPELGHMTEDSMTN